MWGTAQERTALVGAAKVAFLGDALAAPARMLLLKPALKGQVNEELYKRLEQKALKAMPHLKVEQGGGVVGGQFNPITKKVTTADLDPHILAHELGHAEIDTSTLGKLVQNPITTAMGNSGSGVGLIGGAASGYHDEKNEQSHVGRDAALLGGMHLPQLGYEGAASLKGGRMLRELGEKDLSSYAKRMGQAWGTYALNPVAAGVNYGLGRALGRAAARRDKEKTSAATYVKPHMRRAPGTGKIKLPKKAKTANLATVGLHVGEIAPRVDIMQHLARATGKGADELAHMYKNMHLSPSHIQGQAQLAHAAQAAAKPAAPVAAALATKRTPTVGVGHGVQALQGIQKAVTTGAPVRGSADVLSALGQMPGHALGFSGKYAFLIAMKAPDVG